MVIIFVKSFRLNIRDCAALSMDSVMVGILSAVQGWGTVAKGGTSSLHALSEQSEAALHCADKSKLHVNLATSGVHRER